jgi:hypothetical protein
VRIQHRTGELWVLSSAAARAAGLPDDHDGLVWREDGWLGARVPPIELDLPAIGRQAAARGIVGFTDTTPDRTPADAASLAAAGLAQRLHLLVPPGVDVPEAPLVTAGPVKVLLDDTTLPTVDELAATVAAAHAAGRGVAVHCVTRVQLIVALAAGLRAGDRIEHGAVIPAETFGQLHGLTVVTQPHFVAERGEQYAAEVEPGDLAALWRLRSLLQAGIAVAAGTDAPFGGADPWPVIQAATRRPPGLGPGEAIPPSRAIGLFLGRPEAPAVPRRIAPGQPADLTLLRVPPGEAGQAPGAELVAATIVGGEAVYRRAAL